MNHTGVKPQIEPRTALVVDLPGREPEPERFAAELLVRRLRVLWDRRALLFRATLAGLLAGLLLAFLLPKRYDATTQLMPPDSQSSSGLAVLAALSAKTGGGVGAIAGDLLGIKSSGALFLGILRSRTLEDRLVSRFDLKQVYGVRHDVQARARLQDNTSLVEDRKNGILTITVTDRDPSRAAALAHAYVEELDHLVAELSTSSARRERVFLEGRLAAVKQELDQASRDLSQFSSKNGTVDIKEQGRAMVDAAASVMGQLIAAESQLKGLEEIYTPNNARVRALQAHVNELRKQLDTIGGKPEDASSPSSDSSFPSLRKLPVLGVTYADLYRRAKIQEVVYETLTQQYELAKVQEAKETPSVRILDDARIPEGKSFPPRLLILASCALLAPVLAALFLLAQARWLEMDDAHAGKIFAGEVFHVVHAHMPWAPPNGSRFQAASHRLWTRIVPRQPSSRPGDKDLFES